MEPLRVVNTWRHFITDQLSARLSDGSIVSAYLATHVGEFGIGAEVDVDGGVVFRWAEDADFRNVRPMLVLGDIEIESFDTAAERDEHMKDLVFGNTNPRLIFIVDDNGREGEGNLSVVCDSVDWLEHDLADYPHALHVLTLSAASCEGRTDFLEVAEETVFAVGHNAPLYDVCTLTVYHGEQSDTTVLMGNVRAEVAVAAIRGTD